MEGGAFHMVSIKTPGTGLFLLLAVMMLALASPAHAAANHNGQLQFITDDYGAYTYREYDRDSYPWWRDRNDYFGRDRWYRDRDYDYRGERRYHRDLDRGERWRDYDRDYGDRDRSFRMGWGDWNIELDLRPEEGDRARDYDNYYRADRY